MSKGKNQHVTPSPNGGWQIKGARNSKATRLTETQQEAINAARKIAIKQESELIIHNRRGQIREKNTFGHDPNPPKN